MANDDVLKIHDKTVQVVPQNKLFTFDHVFGTTSTQSEIFSTLGDSLIRKFIEGYKEAKKALMIIEFTIITGYNITILAYGQTSSGKTYTMGTAANGNGMNSVDEGIVPRSMALLFDLLHNNNNDTSNRPISPTSSISNNNNNPHKTKFTVKVSFIEIYNEDLHDLLNSAPIDELPPITIREDTKGRIYWTGQGTQNRATGATDMNEKSSRSHAIFSVSLKQEKWIPSATSANDGSKKPRPTSSMSMRSTTPMSNSRLFNAANGNQQPEDGEWLITTSKFHFVDLAGSERLKRTAAEGDRRKEGININAGLLALGNVISALGDPSKKNAHVPYRDSKLTRLLQDSLGGSATTLMIACASPVEYNLAETLNTLQYANRARNIKNRSEKNQVEEWMTTENIELLRTMIGKLKNELNYLKVHSGGKSSSTAHPQHLSVTGTNEDMLDDLSSTSSSITSPSLEDTYHEQRLLISDLQRQLEELDGEASVTRERNRIVEKELQRIRLLESMTRSNNAKEEQVDFQHLVEPVIEEYEKSVAKLESQLALTRAALNHSDMGYEEQQTKITQLEGLLRTQEQTISELRLRLSKILEREQNNESYIHELESKLMKSANETTKDQEMLNELKNRIMKFKETDENTEQYILNLEQRLAAGDAERARLQTSVEDLEAKIEAKERTNVELLKRLSKTTSDTSTEKLILKELDAVNAKYKELEGERDSLQLQITSSVAALNLLQAEIRLKEETERANHLQLTIDRLQYDHAETAKELDEVLQRYHETLEQLDFLERASSSTTAHT
ncbi:P-loop containing nucleoside triphosphate hydrolase protein, partial [Mucor lusitanicus]